MKTRNGKQQTEGKARIAFVEVPGQLRKESNCLILDLPRPAFHYYRDRRFSIVREHLIGNLKSAIAN